MPLLFGMTSLDLYGLAALVSVAVYYLTSTWRRLAHIPTVGGPSLPLLSYLGSLRFLLRGREIINEGYIRYRGKAFKIATLDRWVVVISGKALVDELRRLPEDVMSVQGGLNELLHTEHTMGPEAARDSWPTYVMRGMIGKNLDKLVPDVVDEVTAAFDEYIPCGDKDWVAVPAMDLVQKIVCRASNTLLIGRPACRNPDWISLSLGFSMDVLKGVFAAQISPSFLKPLVGRLMSTVPSNVKRGLKHVSPLIKARRAALLSGADKPNDMLTWMLESKLGATASEEELTARLLALNFGAVHSSSALFLHALYTLAANPQYAVPMRKEAEAVVREHGWTRAAAGEMVQMDSFLKETLRFYAAAGLAIARLAVKPHTFNDGTTVPAGTLLLIAIDATNQDSEHYANAGEFRPFRFVGADAPESHNAGQPFSAVSLDFLPFGYGKHACPGRFFANAELKLMLCHLLLNYDVKTEVDGVRPKDTLIATERIPSMTAKILFRKRQ